MADKLRLKVNGEGLAGFFRMIREQGVELEQIVFLCIGTDRSSGDALGPLAGTLLAEAGYSGVIGTLENPCDAANLAERMKEIPSGKVVIAIDACLGMHDSVGMYQVANQPLEPGKSVGKKLPPAGDYSVAAIVNALGPKQYRTLQTTSLHRVFTMAREIVSAVKTVYPPG
jgi:putative sporulation protein YyaC